VSEYTGHTAHELMKMIEKLTPGGSEFYNNPERCINWANDRMSSAGTLAAERNRLRTQVSNLEEDLRTIRTRMDEEPKWKPLPWRSEIRYIIARALGEKSLGEDVLPETPAREIGELPGTGTMGT